MKWNGGGFSEGPGSASIRHDAGREPNFGVESAREADTYFVVSQNMFCRRTLSLRK